MKIQNDGAENLQIAEISSAYTAGYSRVPCLFTSAVHCSGGSEGGWSSAGPSRAPQLGYMENSLHRPLLPASAADTTRDLCVPSVPSLLPSSALANTFATNFLHETTFVRNHQHGFRLPDWSIANITPKYSLSLSISTITTLLQAALVSHWITALAGSLGPQTGALEARQHSLHRDPQKMKFWEKNDSLNQ